MWKKMRYTTIIFCFGLSACAYPENVTQIRYYQSKAPIRVTVIEADRNIYRVRTPENVKRCEEIFQKGSDAAKMEKRIRDDLSKLEIPRERIEVEVAEFRASICK